MLDIKEIRNHPEEIEKKIRTKEPDLSLKHLPSLDMRLREIKTEVEELKSKRNTLSKQIGEKKRSGEGTGPLMEEVPISPDPADNVCIKTWGERPTFGFAHKNHVELNERLDLFDFKRGARLSGNMKNSKLFNINSLHSINFHCPPH